jgi:hypothetical protein
VVDRRAQQREVFALLLATTAVALPVSGALLYGAADLGEGIPFLGAVSRSDFVPVLMLVGALALLVGTSGEDARSRLARSAAGMVIAAGVILTAAYVGSAYHLRPGGSFSTGATGEPIGWSVSRLSLVGSLLATGAVCTVVGALAIRWLGERLGSEGP